MKELACFRCAILLVLLGMSFLDLQGQKQLVFFVRGNVVARYTEGGYFKGVLKNKKHKEGVINELSEFSMIVAGDTIPFRSIAKLDIKEGRTIDPRKGFGGLFFIAGLGYIAIDQANGLFGYTPKGWDSGDNVALMLAGLGAARLFIKPRYRKLSPGTIIRTVDYRSPYYLNIN